MPREATHDRGPVTTAVGGRVEGDEDKKPSKMDGMKWDNPDGGKCREGEREGFSIETTTIWNREFFFCATSLSAQPKMAIKRGVWGVGGAGQAGNYRCNIGNQ